MTTQTIVLHAALSTPVNAAFSTATTGGTLPAGTHYYRVSALDGHGGETLASAETSQVTTGATSTVTVNWGAVTGATGYKIYGRTSGGQQLLATVGNVTSWTDTGSASPSGALPAKDTTGLLEGTSVDVVVESGITATIGIFVASGQIPEAARCEIYVDTPGADNFEGVLDRARRTTILDGPCRIRLVRKRTGGKPLGAYKEV
jgi:hypothetical protein